MHLSSTYEGCGGHTITRLFNQNAENIKYAGLVNSYGHTSSRHTVITVYMQIRKLGTSSVCDSRIFLFQIKIVKVRNIKLVLSNGKRF